MKASTWIPLTNLNRWHFTDVALSAIAGVEPAIDALVVDGNPVWVQALGETLRGKSLDGESIWLLEKILTHASDARQAFKLLQKRGAPECVLQAARFVNGY